MTVRCRSCGEPIFPSDERCIFTRGSALLTVRMNVGVCTCATYFTQDQMDSAVTQLASMGATEGPVQVHTLRGDNEFQP